MKKIILLIVVLSITIIALLAFVTTEKEEDTILSHVVNLDTQDLVFYWKDEKNQNFSNFGKLKEWLHKKGEKLVFATNGGMYLKDKSPQGLFIQNGIVKKPLDTIQNAYGNFYMQPNGVFYITNKNTGHVVTSLNFSNKDVKFATQSGPMLVIDDEIHPVFRKGSKNVNIRNGVGVLANGHLLFVMSKQKINLFDFASYFKKQGCKNALYLDGFVSKTYLPSKNWESTDGNFGVIIGEIEKE